MLSDETTNMEIICVCTQRYDTSSSGYCTYTRHSNWHGVRPRGIHFPPCLPRTLSPPTCNPARPLQDEIQSKLTHTTDLPINNDAPVRVQRLSTHKLALACSEEHVAGSDFNWLTNSVHWCPIAQAMSALPSLINT